MFNCEHGQFLSEADFANHMEQDHGANMPTAEFMEVVAKAGGGQGIKPLDFGAAPPPVFTPETIPQKVSLPEIPTPPFEAAEVKKAEPQPIKLTYQYTGDCPTCTNPIKTIMLTMGNTNKKGTSLFASAYCIFCNKQLDARKVEPL